VNQSASCGRNIEDVNQLADTFLGDISTDAKIKNIEWITAVLLEDHAAFEASRTTKDFKNNFVKLKSSIEDGIHAILSHWNQ